MFMSSTTEQTAASLNDSARWSLNLDVYRRFAAAQGVRLHETESSLWFEKRRFFLDSVPPHRRIRLRPGEAQGLFRRGAAVVRYTCEEAQGSPSFEFICDDKNFGFDSLASEARRRVRRGLANCDIRSVDFALLAREACAINRSVLARHNRATAFLRDEAQWKSYMALCEQLSNVGAYGAFVDGRLCAFAVTILIEDYCYLFHTHAHSDYLKYSPMNALCFTITKEMLARPDVACVSQGLESFVRRPGLESFKMGMGYRKRPIGRNILVNPLLRPLLSRPALWVAESFFKRVRPSLVEHLSLLSKARNIDHHRASAANAIHQA